MSSTQNAESTVAAALARGARQIGAMVYWTGVGSAGDVQRALWRDGFAAIGLRDRMPGDPEPSALLSTACERAAAQQPRAEARITTEVKAKGASAVHRIMMPRTLTDGRHSRIEEATVSVDAYANPPGPLTVTVAPAMAPDEARDAMLARIEAAYRHALGHLSGQEISDGLVSVMRAVGAITLRPGVYFVAAAHLSLVREVQVLIDQITRARLVVWNIAGDDANAGEARAAAMTSLQEQLAAVIDECREFTARVSVDDAKSRSVAAHDRKFRALAAQAALYTEVLGEYTAALETAIADAREQLLGAYLGDDDASTAA